MVRHDLEPPASHREQPPRHDHVQHEQEDEVGDHHEDEAAVVPVATEQRQHRRHQHEQGQLACADRVGTSEPAPATPPIHQADRSDQHAQSHQEHAELGDALDLAAEREEELAEEDEAEHAGRSGPDVLGCGEVVDEVRDPLPHEPVLRAVDECIGVRFGHSSQTAPRMSMCEMLTSPPDGIAAAISSAFDGSHSAAAVGPLPDSHEHQAPASRAACMAFAVSGNDASRTS